MVETKERKLVIFKDQLYYDIDNRTFKFTDASMGEVDVKSKNAVSSDNDNANDHDLLSRYTDNRDATIRKRLAFCLKNEEILEVSNRPSLNETYEYNLILPMDYPDKNLKVVVTKIHEYLVRGAMMDWYIDTGVAHTRVSVELMDSVLSDLETEIVGHLRFQKGIRKPMQPFGPRE